MDTPNYIAGARAIAKHIGRTERAVYHLLERGQLPGAKRVGGTWTLCVKTFAKHFEPEGSANA